jgi:putative transposase
VGPARTAASLPDLAEDPNKLKVLSEKRRLVELMDEGLSAREAITKLGLPEHRVSWAQKTYRRFTKTGSLVDARWTRRTKRHVLTLAMEQLILQLWNSYPGASPKNVHNLLIRRIEEQRRETDGTDSEPWLVLPAYTTVWEYINALPPAVQAARGGRMEFWDKQGRPVAERAPTLFANQVAQADHTPLRLWARIEVAPGVWIPVQPWLTTVIDLHSRALMGYVVSARYPDAWTIALAIRHAVLEKDDPAWPMHGKPFLIVFDGGKDFGSQSVKSLLGAMAVDVEFCAPHNPNEKPEQERFYHTLKMRIRELRYAMANIGKSEGAALKKLDLLPTIPQVRQEIHHLIGEYHQTPHSAHGELPVTLWTETARVRPAEPQEMDVLLLKDDMLRVVTKEGVRFTLPDGAGGLYRARDLWPHWKEEVRLRYNPDDMLSVLVYAADTGTFICEAWLAGAEGSRYTDDDLIADRKALRAGLAERTRGYVKLTIEQDRPQKRKKAKDDLARKVAEAEAARPAATLAEAERAAKKAEMRELFRRSDRAPAAEATDV